MFFIVLSALLSNCGEKHGTGDSPSRPVMDVRKTDTVVYVQGKVPPGGAFGNVPYTARKDWSYEPGVFKPLVYLCASQDSASAIIDTLKFRSPLTILDMDDRFYRVESEHRRTGYLKRAEVYTHAFYDYDYNRVLLVGMDSLAGFSESRLLVVKASGSTVLERFTTGGLAADCYFNRVYNIALKNVDQMIHLSCSQSNSCPGITTDAFVVHSEGKMQELIRRSGSGESGYVNESSVYLPVKLENGRTVFLKNGSTEVDPLTLKANNYGYTKKPVVPDDELVVVYNEEYENFWDEKKHNWQYDHDGRLRKKIISQSFEYYHWDGKTLKKMKSMYEL